jgi:signal transduction histidine kinase
VRYAPVDIGDGQRGGIAISFGLDAVYAPLRTFQKILIIYVVINTLILAALAFYRISRLYLGPVNRMAQRAEGYRDEDDMPFAVRKQDNELKVLSNALNLMTRRIAGDKKKLKETVRSLEKANAELRRAQAEIVRAEKLSTVGRLASGVAHEIGNPVGIVLGYLELLKRDDTTSTESKDYLERSEEEMLRISSIIQQLLNISRPSAGKPEPLSIHEVLLSVSEMLQVQPLLANIDIQLKMDAREDTVFADRAHIQQILINLVLNAADAISGKGNDFEGRIVLATSVRAAERVSEKDFCKPCPAPVLTIQCIDNGTGIPEDHLANVFDPFYTTKEPQKGTGLGLAVCYMLAQGMEGRLEAASQPGVETVFSLHLPLHVAANEPDSHSNRTQAGCRAGPSAENGNMHD